VASPDNRRRARRSRLDKGGGRHHDRA
jgi:hypothetical protein